MKTNHKEFCLEYTSSNFDGTGQVPLDIGRWTWEDGKYVMDESFNEFQLCDGMYDILEVDGDDEDNPHYSAVLDALSPIFNRQETNLSFVVDGISYAFQVKTEAV